MSFNVRFDTIRDEPGGNRWNDRRHSVIQTIRVCNPDVAGFQEALRSQLDDLVAAFPDYRSLGKPRDVGDTAEYVPVFVRSDRFDLEEHGDFWISPTPDEEGSRGWDTDVPRHCTWARLRDRETGHLFAIFNTHLDRWGSEARIEAAKLIVARVQVAAGLASVVIGDLNAEEDSEPLAILRAAGLTDTFRDVYPDEKDVQTVHHYNDLSGSRKIDYIMRDASWRTVRAAIVRDPVAGRLPSDHFPVVSDLVPR